MRDFTTGVKPFGALGPAGTTYALEMDVRLNRVRSGAFA
jgi:hypothetical protein